MGEATDADGASVERTFYRIVKNPAVTADDFQPAKRHGRPLRDPRLSRQWAEGVSVYDRLDYAMAQARRFRYRLGRFVVALRVSALDGIEVEQSGDDPHHFTLYGNADLLCSIAQVPARRIDGA